MDAKNPTFSWRSELRDSHSLRAWVILPMRRAALLDILNVMYSQPTSEVVDCDRDGDLAKCKSQVVRNYIMPNLKGSKAEVRNSPLSLHTLSEERDGSAFEMPASTVG